MGGDKIGSKPYFPHLEKSRSAWVQSCAVTHNIFSPFLSSLCVAWLYSLEELALDCPSLIMLDVSGCHKLSEEGRKELNCRHYKDLE